MKSLRSFFNHALTLALLLALGVGVVWFFNRPAPDTQPVAQEATSPLPTPTSVSETATSLPTVEVTATPTPISTDTPPDEAIEPTWTPVIVLPEGSPPPVPTPIPTPTATPINPDESVIAAFDNLVGGLTISPNDQMLAISAEVETVPEGVSVHRQIWTIDLASKKVEKLDAYGVGPVWSPNGQQILLRSRQGDEFDIKVVDRNGRNEKSLARLNRDELLGYDWLSPQLVNIINLDGIFEVDLSGRVINQKSRNLPSGLREQVGKQADIGPNDEVVVIDHQDRKLLIAKPDGQNEKIADEAGRSIFKFRLAANKERLAYVVNEGAHDELWINTLSDTSPQKLYRIEQGHIRDLLWMPDEQTILIGWGETGTNTATFLLWLDAESGEQQVVGVHGVDSNNLVLSHRGDKLFYSRSVRDDTDGSYQTTIYQLEIKR